MKSLALAILLSTTVISSAFAQVPLDKKAVEKIVHDYIIANPEVILESMENMQKKIYEEEAGKARKAIKDNAAQLLNDADSPVAGNPKGDVTVVEFFDYNCGYCKKMTPVILKLIEKDKNVRVVFKEYPILSASSELASRAALAVHRIDPKKYLAYHEALMKHGGEPTESFLLDEASKLGFDKERVKTEMKNSVVTAIMDRDRALAATINVRGTPGFVIGDELIPQAMSFDDMQQKVTALRMAKKK